MKDKNNKISKMNTLYWSKYTYFKTLSTYLINFCVTDILFITFAYLEYNCFYFLHLLQLDTLPIRQQDRISTAFSHDVALLPYTVLVCWPYSIYNQKHNKIQNENVYIYEYLIRMIISIMENSKFHLWYFFVKLKFSFFYIFLLISLQMHGQA